MFRAGSTKSQRIRNNQIFTNPPPTNTTDGRFKVLLTNPKTKHLVLPADTELDGDDIAIEPGRYKEKQFTIKTKISINLEKDPNFNCKVYENGTSFESCIGEDVVQNIRNEINCTPPWMALDYEEDICQGSLNIYKPQFEKMATLVQNLFNRDSSSCQTPCSSVTYRSHLDYYFSQSMKNTGDKNILMIRFEESAVVYRARFSIGVDTLLTRIGGYIGGGRTLLWIVVVGFGFMKTVYSLLSSCGKQSW